MAVTEPRRLPGRLLDLLRGAFRRAWQTRGGGLYATGVFVTFFSLETVTLVTEFSMAQGAGDFVTSQLMDVLLRFSAASIANTVYSLVWPVWLIERYGAAWGFGMLAALYLVFEGVIRKPLQRWLFAGELEQEKENTVTQKDSTT